MQAGQGKTEGGACKEIWVLVTLCIGESCAQCTLSHIG